jgi:hypothetical protein
MTATVEVGVDGQGSVSVLVRPPLGGDVVYRYTGRGEVSFAEPSGRIGRVVAEQMVRERVGTSQLDPDVAAVLESTTPATASGSIAWMCPEWP